MFNLWGNSMTPGTIFISVWNCRCAVSRYVPLAGGIATDPAANWEALEDDACAAVEAQGGAFNLSGHYLCPPELSERAEWPAPEESEGPVAAEPSP